MPCEPTLQQLVIAPGPTAPCRRHPQASPVRRRGVRYLSLLLAGLLTGLLMHPVLRHPVGGAHGGWSAVSEPVVNGRIDRTLNAPKLGRSIGIAGGHGGWSAVSEPVVNGRIDRTLDAPKLSRSVAQSLNRQGVCVRGGVRQRRVLQHRQRSTRQALLLWLDQPPPH